MMHIYISIWMNYYNDLTVFRHWNDGDWIRGICNLTNLITASFRLVKYSEVYFLQPQYVPWSKHGKHAQLGMDASQKNHLLSEHDTNIKTRSY